MIHRGLERAVVSETGQPLAVTCRSVQNLHCPLFASASALYALARSLTSRIAAPHESEDRLTILLDRAVKVLKLLQ
jgi:hypothetical protein